MSRRAGSPAESSEARRPAAHLGALALLFFASGAAALVVETTWLRWLRLLLGATAPAASATLVAFFFGSALGAAGAARIMPRVTNPLRFYAALEIAAAAWGLAVPVLLEVGAAIIAGSYEDLQGAPVSLTLVRFAIALAATLPAAACYGATLPAIGAVALSTSHGLGRRGAGLYAINTLGGAAGVALCSFWLPPWLGVWGTYLSALGLSLVLGLGVLAASRRATPSRTTAGRRERSAASPPPWPRPLLGLALASGFGSFAAQVLFVQAFAQVLDQSVHAFGAVLVGVLTFLAVGGLLAVRVSAWGPVASHRVACLALVASALGLLAFPALLHAATGDHAILIVDGGWLGYVGQSLWAVAWTAGPALLPAALVFPATFVLAEHALGTRSAGDAGAQLGRLSAANTVGAIAGAIAGSYLLIPAAGLWLSFGVLSLAYFAAAIVAALWLKPEMAPRRATGIAAFGFGAALWVAILVLAGPGEIPLTRLEPDARLLDQRSTPAGVVSVVERPTGRLIRTDNHYSLGGSGEIVHQERQAHLPLLLKPDARRVAFVGTATGITAGAALAHPVERVILVELVPAVVRAAALHFAPFNRGIYQDPRSVAVVDDARNYFGASREVFDLVVADLFVPWRSGTGSLYTREHFEAVRERLSDDGLFVQWLPLYQLERDSWLSIAATFYEAFPNSAVFRGDFYGAYPIVALVGWAGRPATAEAVSRAAARLARSGERDRWVTDATGVWSLYVGPLSGLTESMAAAPLNEDGWPVIEFATARRHAGQSAGPPAALTGMAWVEIARQLAAASQRDDSIYPNLSVEARRAKEGGAALQLAGALYTSRRFEEAGRALALAAERLPAPLLLEGEADPTAAELWHTN